jgi:anti-sigma factor RsiW
MTCDEVRPLIREATRGGLDPATRERVYEHLATCPACQSVADEERDLDLLLEQHLPQFPAPLALKRRLQSRLPPEPRRPRARPRWLAPLALAAVAGAAAVVLVVRPPSPSSQGNPLVAEAVSDHLRVVYRDHPVDIEGGGPHQVKPWFTGRIDFALPSVFGGNDEFTLEGGSVGYYLDRQAAVLVYARSQHRASLFVFRADGLSFPKPDHTLGRVAATVTHARGFSVIVWRDGELGYALASDLSADELVRLAVHVVNGS